MVILTNMTATLESPSGRRQIARPGGTPKQSLPATGLRREHLWPIDKRGYPLLLKFKSPLLYEIDPFHREKLISSLQMGRLTKYPPYNRVSRISLNYGPLYNRANEQEKNKHELTRISTFTANKPSQGLTCAT